MASVKYFLETRLYSIVLNLISKSLSRSPPLRRLFFSSILLFLAIFAIEWKTPVFKIPPVAAYSADLHQYWTVYLAGLIGFNFSSAWLIASGDQHQDDGGAGWFEGNRGGREACIDLPLNGYGSTCTTVVNPGWHAFGKDKTYTENRRDALYERIFSYTGVNAKQSVTNGTLQLLRLGQLLHFVQDIQSHWGYPNTVGHSYRGYYPDYLNEDHHDKDVVTTEATLSWMQTYLKDPRHTAGPSTLKTICCWPVSLMTLEHTGYTCGFFGCSYDEEANVNYIGTLVDKLFGIPQGRPWPALANVKYDTENSTFGVFCGSWNPYSPCVPSLPDRVLAQGVDPPGDTEPFAIPFNVASNGVTNIGLDWCSNDTRTSSNVQLLRVVSPDNVTHVFQGTVSLND